MWICKKFADINPDEYDTLSGGNDRKGFYEEVLVHVDDISWEAGNSETLLQFIPFL